MKFRKDREIVVQDINQTDHPDLTSKGEWGAKKLRKMFT